MTQQKKAPRVPAREAVAASLRQHGPMTCAQLADAMDWPQPTVENTLVNARARFREQMFRVVGYLPPDKNGGTKTQNIYAAEKGKDVPRPVVDERRRRSKTRARYRLANRAQTNAAQRARYAKRKGRSVVPSHWAGLSTDRAVRVAMGKRTLQAARTQEGGP